MKSYLSKRSMLVGMMAVALAVPASAHHGWGEYDATKLLSLTGTVRAFAYENPHGTLRLATPEKTWLVILAPPSRMQSRGLPRDAIRLGDEVTVEGYPSRSDAQEMRAERIRVAGKVTELR